MTEWVKRHAIWMAVITFVMGIGGTTIYNYSPFIWTGEIFVIADMQLDDVYRRQIILEQTRGLKPEKETPEQARRRKEFFDREQRRLKEAEKELIKLRKRAK